MMLPYEDVFVSLLVGYKFWRDDHVGLGHQDFKPMYEQIMAYERGWC